MSKLERVPTGLAELVGQEAKRKGVPKTFVYKEIEEAMRMAGTINQIFQPPQKKHEKPLFRF